MLMMSCLYYASDLLFAMQDMVLLPPGYSCRSGISRYALPIRCLFLPSASPAAHVKILYRPVLFSPRIRYSCQSRVYHPSHPSHPSRSPSNASFHSPFSFSLYTLRAWESGTKITVAFRGGGTSLPTVLLCRVCDSTFSRGVETWFL